MGLRSKIVRIPTMGSTYETWSWPDADVVWFAVVANADIIEFDIQASWEVAEKHHRVLMK